MKTHENTTNGSAEWVPVELFSSIFTDPNKFIAGGRTYRLCIPPRRILNVFPAPGIGGRSTNWDEELHCQRSDPRVHWCPISHTLITEGGGWDTSKALVRRTLEECIRRGRAQRANGQKADEYEAYRLLGQAVSIQRYLSLARLVIFSSSRSYTPSKISPLTQISVNLLSGRWVIPRSSCTSEIR